MLKTIQRFYSWKGIKADISRYLRSCDYCETVKPFAVPPPLTPIVATKKRNRAIFDLTDMGEDAHGYRYILVLIDSFTKYVWTAKLPTKESKPISDWFFILHYDNFDIL
jgi:hypothetical protein